VQPGISSPGPTFRVCKPRTLQRLTIPSAEKHPPALRPNLLHLPPALNIATMIRTIPTLINFRLRLRRPVGHALQPLLNQSVCHAGTSACYAGPDASQLAFKEGLCDGNLAAAHVPAGGLGERVELAGHKTTWGRCPPPPVITATTMASTWSVAGG
jgi:hypothetical protein